MDCSARLTKPQLRLLSQIEFGTCHCIDDYKPMLALCKRGFAEYHPGKFGNGKLEITESGGKYLAIKKASPQ